MEYSYRSPFHYQGNHRRFSYFAQQFHLSKFTESTLIKAWRKFNHEAERFFLTFISFIICFIFLSSISDIAYSQGYESEIVFQTQKNLQELGYNPGPLDGIWGRKTQSTLKKFQHDNGLSMTGKLDSKTKEKLGIISLDKSVPKRSIPVISIQGRVREALARVSYL